MMTHHHKIYGGSQMQPQTLESYLPHVQEQLAGIFEARPCEELFSSEAPQCINEQHLSISNEAPSLSSYASFNLQPQETIMNTETHVYNYSSSADPETSAELTQRLYPSTNENGYETPSQEKELSSSISHSSEESFDHDIALSSPPVAKSSTTFNSQDLDRTIQDYHGFQSNQLSSYLERWLRRPLLPDHCLQIFHGWRNNNDSHTNHPLNLDSTPSTLEDISADATGGFYLRWNNTGIVVNPGKKFMQHFHKAGLHIKDIDIVLVTHENAETYADIQDIYELNFRLNRASGDQQIIHYYLNHNAFRELSILLKPHSKSERNAIHCLELFPESPEVEQIQLRDGILLHYFTTQPQFSLASTSLRNQSPSPSHLGLRLELSKSPLNESSNITLGYISGSWSPFIEQYLTNCDILLAGIGNTNESDYNKLVHLDDCLGYYGVCSLLEETLPKLLVCTEFGARDGDLRLELIKKMRSEYADYPTHILPGDIGLCIDLNTLAVKCSITHEYTTPNQIRIIRSSGIFGMLHYLAPANYL